MMLTDGVGTCESHPLRHDFHLFFINFQPPCKNNKTAGTFCFPTFQVLFYIEENTATQRIDIFVDFHAD